MKLHYLLLFIAFFSLSCKKNKEKKHSSTEFEAKEQKVTQSSVLDISSWLVGEGSVKNFKSFGKERESKRIKMADQDGKHKIVWECIPDTTTTWDGGFITSSIPIDNNFAYRYSVWVKKTGGNSGRIYYAVTGVSETTGEYIKHANFIHSGTILKELGEWHLLVGYIYPKNHIDDIEKDPISGLYYNGEKIQEGRDFKWKENTSEFKIRTLLNDCKNGKEERLYIVNPQLFKIDGSEPSLDDIL